MFLYYFQLLVVFASFIVISQVFLFDTKGIAPTPCICSREFTYCNSRQLQQFPTFTEHDQNEKHNEFYVRLNNNLLSTIPPYAFKNLSSINASYIYLHFEYNQIYNIDLTVFDLIETNMTYLNLEHNSLTYLPPALGKLSSLNYLLLLDNPLASLDAIYFVNMSSKLRTLSISTLNFSSFPHELHFLTTLQSLTIHNIIFPDLNTTVVQIFETSLTNLDLSFTNFTSTPSAVCHLHALQSLTANYSHNLGMNNVSIFDKYSSRMVFTTPILCSIMI